MLALMNEDADWYRNEDTERFKRIQELCKKIETASTRQFSSHISKERFEAYQKMGLQFKRDSRRIPYNNYSVTAMA